METQKRNAVIDADFFNKLTEYASDHGKLFVMVMDALKISPVMHEYVANVELERNPVAEELIQNGTIEVYCYEQYITEDNKEDYNQYFRDAFEAMNAFEFPEDKDIYTYAERQENLGEIRSIYLAKALKMPLFMTDDNGAIRFVQQSFSSKSGIEAKSLYEALVECKEKGAAITYKQINSTIAHAFGNRRTKLEKLKSLYISKL